MTIMLAACLKDEKCEVVEDSVSAHVDYEGFRRAEAEAVSNGAESPGKKLPLKSFNEIESLVQCGKTREVKQIIRDNCWGPTDAIRGELWPLLCRQHAPGKATQDGFYWELVTQLFGNKELPDKGCLLPQFVESQHKHTYHLSKRGMRIADRVVCVLGFACPDITYSPTIYPVAALLLHFMTEEEAFLCLETLVTCKKTLFIPQSKLHYEVTWRTVMHITKKYVKSAAGYVGRNTPAARAEAVYTEWLWWIFQALPFYHLVRVMDCFLNEGIKVLYRVTMGILVLFHKASSGSSAPFSKDLSELGIDSTISRFCSRLPVPPSKLLKISFGVRNLSSAYIQRVFLKTEMALKSRAVLGVSPTSNSARTLQRSRSTENLPTSQSQVDIQMTSHTLTIREESERVVKMRIQSTPGALSKMLLTLWSWLPVRITMYQPCLLYTTEEHGCSLTTFYLRVENYEPTLMMIKTCNNEVFGAYCSTRWVERNQKDERGNRMTYFGTGETFLFSLYPERAKYPWVGMEGGQVQHKAELFMAADAKMITIGGGEGQAIWMDENIRYGKSDRCLTFNNPPLCPGRDFEIKVLEVYGFGAT